MQIGILAGAAWEAGTKCCSCGRKRPERRFAPLVYHLGTSKYETCGHEREHFVLGDEGEAGRRQASFFSLASPFDAAPDMRYKP